MLCSLQFSYNNQIFFPSAKRMVSIPYSSGRQRYALKGIGTKGQRDKVLKGINLFFVVSFRLKHSTFFPLHPYIPNPYVPALLIPTSLIPMFLRRRRSIPYSSGLSFRVDIDFTGDTKPGASQSLIHQVSISDSNIFQMNMPSGELVSIPYSSGLSFR